MAWATTWLTIQQGDEDKPAAVLYFLDSGEYAPQHIGGYEWIHGDQINWYTRAIQPAF